jgi:hypothetical protein
LTHAERPVEAPEQVELRPGEFVRDLRFVVGGAGMAQT